ncbi:hypothetical protein Csa_018351 [Cucumis sativus]|nr:hypothetical protein Csa_018351 [Cucumis sativus]
MEAYNMKALDIWEAVEEDYEISALPDNPTMAQIKAQKEKKRKKSKAKEQRRTMKQEGVVEGALPAKHHENVRNNKEFFKKNQISTRESLAYNKVGINKGSYPPCPHCNI